MHKVAVVVGSIRKDSHNKKLARALAKLAEGKLDFRTIRIDDLPLLNQDQVDDPPPAVLRFKREVEDCDAVLFVTPEHNRSVPAAMKNAFDWGTRPIGRDSWAGKTAAIIGTSGGAISTALAQQAMRTMASGHVSALLGAPDAFIRYQEGLFAPDGTTTDDKTRAFLQLFIDNFARLVAAMEERSGGDVPGSGVSP
ncbi:MAG TPA: NADPH-dependent FMN reductase [Gammaproteobacteria bacterium]|nr:NADPH-dependent FMN reductase [Gammaproteobacteria bacterium]